MANLNVPPLVRYAWICLCHAGLESQELQDAGMEIVEPANDEKEWIEAATTQVWPQFYDAVGGKERLDSILATLNR